MASCGLLHVLIVLVILSSAGSRITPPLAMRLARAFAAGHLLRKSQMHLEDRTGMDRSIGFHPAKKTRVQHVSNTCQTCLMLRMLRMLKGQCLLSRTFVALFLCAKCAELLEFNSKVLVRHLRIAFGLGSVWFKIRSNKFVQRHAKDSLNFCVQIMIVRCFRKWCVHRATCLDNFQNIHVLKP